MMSASVKDGTFRERKQMKLTDCHAASVSLALMQVAENDLILCPYYSHPLDRWRKNFWDLDVIIDARE